jgi:hypothetical protein
MSDKPTREPFSQTLFDYDLNDPRRSQLNAAAAAFSSLSKTARGARRHLRGLESA